MSTRSSIAVKLADGKIKAVYCHSDGYPSYVGALLKKYYNTQIMAEALVALGDLSMLGERLNPSGKHSFENREDGVTVAYHRDREEEYRDTKYDTEKAYWKDADRYGASYQYLFKEGKWFVNETELTEQIIEED